MITGNREVSFLDVPSYIALGTLLGKLQLPRSSNNLLAKAFRTGLAISRAVIPHRNRYATAGVGASTRARYVTGAPKITLKRRCRVRSVRMTPCGTSHQALLFLKGGQQDLRIEAVSQGGVIDHSSR